jgi:lipopolysaccharide export system permease protein
VRLAQKYIAGEILRTFFLILLAIILFIFISNLLDSMPMLMHHKPSLPLVISYFIFNTPFLAAESTPFAMLLSILFVFSQLNKNNELTAMKSLGMSFYSLAAPVLGLSLIVCFCAILFNETVVSYSADKAKYIKETLIEKRDDTQKGVVRDMAKLSRGGLVYYIRHFDGLLGVMKGICVLKLDKEFNMIERLDAMEGEWHEGKWILKKGSLRQFEEGVEKSVEVFDTRELPVSETPDDFIVRRRSAEDTLTINVVRLSKHIEVLKESGFKYHEEAVNFHLKFAFPFATFILALLGISVPFLFTAARSAINAALGFLFTVITAFFYMGFVTIALSAGKAAAMPPIVAAWMPNIIFTVIGLILLKRTQK